MNDVDVADEDVEADAGGGSGGWKNTLPALLPLPPRPVEVVGWMPLAAALLTSPNIMWRICER